jgi:CRISPR/Cas system-associated exonuclease Cas4 (RecB family)
MQRGIEIHAACEDYLNDVKDLPALPHFQEELKSIKQLGAKAEAKFGLTDDWKPEPNWDNAWGKCILDAVYTEHDYVVIVDFKTGKPNTLSHLDQAQIYALACEAYYPNRSAYHTQFWYLDQNITTQHTFTQPQLTKYRETLNKRINKLLTDHTMQAKPSKYVCKWCDYKDHCDYAYE